MTQKSQRSDFWRLEWRSVDGRGEPAQEWLRSYLKGTECPLCGVRTFPSLEEGEVIPVAVPPKWPFFLLHRTPFDAVPDKILEKVKNRIAPHARHVLVDEEKQEPCGWSAIRFKGEGVVSGEMLDDEANEMTCRRCKQIRYDRVPKIGLPFGFVARHEMWSVGGFQTYISDALLKEQFWNNFRKVMLVFPARYAGPSRVVKKIKKHRP